MTWHLQSFSSYPEDDLWPVWWRLQGLQRNNCTLSTWYLLYLLGYPGLYWSIISPFYLVTEIFHKFSDGMLSRGGDVRNVTCKCVTVTVIFWQLVKLHYLYLWQIYKWQSNLEPRKYHYHLTIVICYERFL